MGGFMKDLMEEFDKDYSVKIKELEDTNSVDDFIFSKVTKKFQKNVQDWIRPVFIKIISEEKYSDD